MQKAVILDKGKAGLVEVPTPTAKEDWALVKIHVAPMCTEYKLFRDGVKAEFLGHEAAGEVVAVAQPGPVQVGDRVAVMPLTPCGVCALCLNGDYIHCQHGMNVAAFTGSPEGGATYAQYLLKPAGLLPRIPEGVSYEHGAMACCGLGPTFGAFRRMNVNAYDTILITGLGPVGLGGVINARYLGARVIGVDSNPYRAKLAGELGAEAVLDPDDPDGLARIRSLTGGFGVDKAVDCSGVAAAQRLMLDATRRKGHVAFVGEAGDLTLHVSNDLIRKGLTLHGAWHYNRADVPTLMQVIVRSGPALDRLITHTFPLSRVQDAFALQLTGNSGKVILKPWE